MTISDSSLEDDLDAARQHRPRRGMFAGGDADLGARTEGVSWRGAAPWDALPEAQQVLGVLP